jgi:hypothetical protein
MSTLTNDHFPMFRLESHVAGKPDADVAKHLLACAACSELCETLTADLRAFQKTSQVDVFLDAVAKRAEQQEQRKVVPLPLRAKGKVLAWGGAVLAAAAVLFVMVRTPSTTFVTETLDPLERVTFKGGEPLQLALVRERAGVQERVTGALRLRAGDRIRAEVSLDRSRPIEAVLVRDDGKRFPMLAPTALDVGVHFSPESIRFDAEAFAGFVIAGEPAKVEEALAKKVYDQVRVIRVQTE